MFGVMVGFGVAFGVLGLARLVHRRRHRSMGRHAGRAAEWLGRKLDATPGQVEAMRDVFREVSEAMASVRGGLGSEASILSAMLREETPNRSGFDELMKEHGERLNKLRETVFEGIERIHAVLEPEQRERLARIIETRMHHRAHAC